MRDVFLVYNKESGKSSIKNYISHLDNADILVNCAGINDLASIEEMTEETELEERRRLDGSSLNSDFVISPCRIGATNRSR